jgi:hypothetical protein
MTPEWDRRAAPAMTIEELLFSGRFDSVSFGQAL